MSPEELRVHRELEYLRSVWTSGRRRRKKGQSRAKDKARQRERGDKLDQTRVDSG